MKKWKKNGLVLFALLLAAAACKPVSAVETGSAEQPAQVQESPAAEQIPAEPPKAPQTQVGIIPIVDMRGNQYSFDASKVFQFAENPSGGAPLLRMDEVVLEKEFKKIAEIFDIKGRDANISINTKGELVELTKEEQEILFDRKLTKADLIAKVKNGDYSPYYLSFQFGRLPKRTEEKLKKINYVLAEYTTSFNAGEEKRTGNIALGASFINGKVLMPGEEFSFLQTAGPLSTGKGYKNAKIIQNGKFVDGIAGGACQVSTTLFNATLQSGLQITSRRNHSLAISYVPRGRDAAVATGLDFRFKNNLPNPVYLQAYVHKNNITMKVYGSVEDRKDVQISVKNTGERKYTLTRSINGIQDQFHSSYGIKKQ